MSGFAYNKSLFPVKHYKVTVLSLNKFFLPPVEDEGVYLSEKGEVLSIYSHHQHNVGDFFTTWFSGHVDILEKDNFLSLGRIKRIEQFRGRENAKYYVTKLGRFIVEE